jgi:hypothetical protein
MSKTWRELSAPEARRTKTHPGRVQRDVERQREQEADEQILEALKGDRNGKDNA